MHCPKDATALTTQTWEGDVKVETCASCGGTWAERGEIERIQALHVHDHRRELRDFDDTVGRAIEFAKQAQLAPAKCPVCDEEMAEEDYGYGSQILVERCPKGHGIWLDAGELEALEIWFERHRQESQTEPTGVLAILSALARRFGAI